MTPEQVKKYQSAVSEIMASNGGIKWLELCISQPSKDMTEEHIDMISKVLTGK